MSFPIQNANQSNPFSGVFGNGQVQMFPKTGTFTVPLNVKRVRVRLWGGGGIAGGGGGGFAMKVCDVTPAQVIAVTVGAGSSGTSSFGAFCSATGGANSNGAGGIGTGGDVNYQGGQGDVGGGGAANLFGDGSEAGYAGTSGGGAKDQNIWGGSGFTGQGGFTHTSATNPQVPATATIISSIDYIGTGGGGGYRSDGWNGGGGGTDTGNGGFPAGGGHQNYASGLLIVEY